MGFGFNSMRGSRRSAPPANLPLARPDPFVQKVQQPGAAAAPMQPQGTGMTPAAAAPAPMTPAQQERQQKTGSFGELVTPGANPGYVATPGFGAPVPYERPISPPIRPGGGIPGGPGSPYPIPIPEPYPLPQGPQPDRGGPAPAPAPTPEAGPVTPLPGELDSPAPPPAAPAPAAPAPAGPPYMSGWELPQVLDAKRALDSGDPATAMRWLSGFIGQDLGNDPIFAQELMNGGGSAAILGFMMRALTGELAMPQAQEMIAGTVRALQARAAAGNQPPLPNEEQPIVPPVPGRPGPAQPRPTGRPVPSRDGTRPGGSGGGARPFTGR